MGATYREGGLYTEAICMVYQGRTMHRGTIYCVMVLDTNLCQQHQHFATNLVEGKLFRHVTHTSTLQEILHYLLD